MTICDRCGNNNPVDSRFCNSCGSQLEPDVAHPPAQPAQIVPDEQPCPRCGGGVPAYMDICPKCAASLMPLGTVHEPERKCPRCGRVLEHGSMVCPVCIWTRTDSIETILKPKSYMPIIVGVLLLAAFILAILSSIMILGSWGTWESLENTSLIDIGGLASCCVMILWFGAISSLLGAILSFKRSKYTLVILAAAFGMLGLGPFYLASVFSLIALIIAAISKDDYKS